jgi:hypothetical protein
MKDRLENWPRSSVTRSVFQPDRSALRLLLVAQMQSAAMSAIPSLSGEERT